MKLRKSRKFTKADIEALAKISREYREVKHESELRPMLEAGFTRSQAEWILENLLTNA